MKTNDFTALFEQAKRRYHLVGDEKNGVIMGLDLEGRLFTILNGEIVNRINPDSILQQTTAEEYLNPGGDGLWPAPEGTCLGYEYPSGNWRVPPGLTGARYIIVEQNDNSAKMNAEIDLINNLGLGIPTVFGRTVSIVSDNNSLHVSVIESIKYIGDKPLSKDQCLLAPWSLCQFDSGPGCEVTFPDQGDSSVRDLYDSSDSQRFIENELRHTKTDCAMRYQVGIDETVPWIEFHNPETGLRVKRSADPLPDGQNYIDIVDAPPNEKPIGKGVRYSVYSDTSGFMEIEAAGGCPETINPGTEMSVKVDTVYSI